MPLTRFDQGPPYKILDRVLDSDIVTRLLIDMIRSDEELHGEITVHKAIRPSKEPSSKKISSKKTKDRTTTDDWVAGQAIKDMRLNLKEGDAVVLVWDGKVPVVPGGVATGAKGRGLAMGGRGEGGKVTPQGHKLAGDGQGGDLIGKDAQGEGGEGRGGIVDGGRAGAGGGGDVVIREPRGKSG